jgi:hypothetical protein
MTREEFQHANSIDEQHKVFMMMEMETEAVMMKGGKA